ncbi:MAG: ribosome maturation factor RimP [Nitrospinae bacterium]|nr:ribosome maturation factor RimP [Nitrospinota bacterium]
MTMDILDKIRGIIEPVVKAEGLELWDVEFAGGGGGRRTLAVYVDKEGGVDVEDCASASRQISLALDSEDVIPEAYMLEVSSPGLTRPLKKPMDFIRAIGKLAAFKLRVQLAGSNKILATITSADEKGVTVSLKKDGQIFTIPYQDVAKAHLEIEF